MDRLPDQTLYPPLQVGIVLPVARYRFSFRMEDDLRLPEYAGSLLRGQFGAALRRTACMTGERECEGCPLYRTCPYPAIFETPPPESHPLEKFSQVPNPYDCVDGLEGDAGKLAEWVAGGLWGDNVDPQRRAEGYNLAVLGSWI